MPKPPAGRLEAFLDFTCPYSRLTFAALRVVGEEAGVEVAIRPYELYPEPAALRDPEEPWEWREAAAERIAELRLTFGAPPAQRPRTRKAHEAAAFAEAAGRGVEFREAVFHAYWAEGRDVGRLDVLVELGESVELDPFALRVALDIDRHEEEVEGARREAEELGIAGTPVLVLRDGREHRIFAGAASPGEIREFLRESAGQGRRA
jgi:predicted DsbA family dithiol-disulfide isomerase